MTIVDREGHGENVLGVSHEATGGASGINLPKTKGAIPRSREGELTIGGNDNIGNKVRVTAEGALGVAVGIVLAGVGVSEAPADDGFVTGAGEDEVGVFAGGGDGCYPVAVAAEGASEGESFGHLELVWKRKRVGREERRREKREGGGSHNYLSRQTFYRSKARRPIDNKRILQTNFLA